MYDLCMSYVLKQKWSNWTKQVSWSIILVFRTQRFCFTKPAAQVADWQERCKVHLFTLLLNMSKRHWSIAAFIYFPQIARKCQWSTTVHISFPETLANVHYFFPVIRFMACTQQLWMTTSMCRDKNSYWVRMWKLWVGRMSESEECRSFRRHCPWTTIFSIPSLPTPI